MALYSRNTPDPRRRSPKRRKPDKAVRPVEPAVVYAAVRDKMNTVKFVHPFYGLCLYWAAFGVTEIRSWGRPAIIQAGTASWPRIRPEEDDGVMATHFSYVWTPGSRPDHAAGKLPEMHVWIALPDTLEVVDFTTSLWPDQCRKVTGMEWTAPDPPPWIWTKRLPPGVVYTPDHDAIALARTLIADELKILL